MKEIKLTGSLTTMVDDEDYWWLKKHNWLQNRNMKTIYAVRYDCRWAKTKIIYMHREVLGLKVGDGKVVDHIDLNGLNNQKKNLRVVTKQQNSCRRVRQINNTSGYIGVVKIKNKWIARIKDNYKSIYLGCFDDPVEAAKRYDEEARKRRGEFAVCNFI